MLMGDVLTLGQHNLPVKVILFNNHSLGMVRLEMEVAGMSPFGCNLKNPHCGASSRALRRACRRPRRGSPRTRNARWLTMAPP